MRRRRALLATSVLALATLSAAADAGPTHAGVNPDALLPDLAVLPPSDLQIVVRDSGRRVLRFTSVVVNVGRGPFQVTGYDPKDGDAAREDTLSVRQQTDLVHRGVQDALDIRRHNPIFHHARVNF